MVKSTSALFILFASVGIYYFPRNPTQRFSQFISLLKDGVPGNENMTEFDKIYEGNEGNQQQSAKSDPEVADAFYNLATKFYEYGWGDSFHFGWRKIGEPHSHSIRNSQAFVAQKLQVGEMDPVLDLGCGIGGPLRGIVRLTGANVTGLTINKHQVVRAREINSQLTPHMQARCNHVVMDYTNIKGLEPNSYKAAFYMESSLHVENRTSTFAETFRLLKPGGRLVAMEYVTLPAWDEKNPEHVRLMGLHLHGNGAARTPSIEEALAMMTKAGFVVEEHYDFMSIGKKLYVEDEFPWWGDLLEGRHHNFIASLLPAHPWVRNYLPYVLDPLAKIGLIPKDVPAAAELMNMGGDGLAGLGRLDAITPQYYVLGVKPMV